MTEHALPRFIAQHPRLLGALFAMGLVLTQSGVAAAGRCAAFHGP